MLLWFYHDAFKACRVPSWPWLRAMVARALCEASIGLTRPAAISCSSCSWCSDRFLVVFLRSLLYVKWLLWMIVVFLWSLVVIIILLVVFLWSPVVIIILLVDCTLDATSIQLDVRGASIREVRMTKGFGQRKRLWDRRYTSGASRLCFVTFLCLWSSLFHSCFSGC